MTRQSSLALQFKRASEGWSRMFQIEMEIFCAERIGRLTFRDEPRTATARCEGV